MDKILKLVGELYEAYYRADSDVTRQRAEVEEALARLVQAWKQCWDRGSEMQPMGNKQETVEELAQRMREELAQRMSHDDPRQDARPALLDAEETEIALPEDRYGIACIGCGIEMHLQMLPHRDESGLLVGWVFCCEGCRPQLIGRRMWWGEQE